MPDFAEAVLLSGRVLFGSLFVVSAIGHLTKGTMMMDQARTVGLPVPVLATWPAGLWLAAGALSITLGAWPDLGALMLGIFVVPAALYFHRFWNIDDEYPKQVETLSFARNVTLLGACLALFAFFATVGHSLDLTLTGPLFDLR
jgi:putative oxidoreductase